MVKREDDIKKYIEKYYYIIKDLYKIKKVFLFGSYANGNQTKDSDIDVCVVIEDLEKLDEIKVLCDLFKNSKKISTLIEPYCMSWRDYTHPKHGSIAAHIIKSERNIITA